MHLIICFIKLFGIENYNNLNKYVDLCLQNMFPNIEIRIYSAKIKNPNNFKNITLLLDGHDSTVDYGKLHTSAQKKWSYKLKTSGLRAQILAGVNNMVLQ
jgi:phosphohistidine phosphatase SixA